ncbi:mitochondrial 54S ribosomal protein YmL41 [Ophidiomyces ophidiicola]|uniref:Mitochondrial 54S ribosomal protein YmL41 n=1 Tax=Ophidiomyces ophidiicola TaxID=1387563 RepID=A0ACB8UVY6_9EURO|nr:mitochondrial 54S ribosomal protein YmL41 [Ophidiomyces ophidiicola]KAI1916611.1 mitochondrial 54S ribosomal protein YmL41 [Ophidiomyces ophidiicola]KAI1918352.1 mitochondrial 54S ribosomal protein YmL41 [Ophidiomyces ophidiicola]KAI1925808.1 mitochondrial 54S ribosomal protein YmL41 [Ophidiomyces ophidiicola]KAI1944998.1 mitochondrial 54S ribosomal protein YmL41 [Ophidiomyces ophidiicola]KAI1945111.1 mitochondrial 54S ribosomal protein YmL41 [Ophidiomyces ophidiicola]
MPRAPSLPKVPSKLYTHPVPVEQRKQVYLPEFTITLIRTPFLPPRYASFWVPLSFNKLDLKDYLKRAYNVDVIKVRSYVEQQKVTRERALGKEGFGPLRRPMAKKKMTVEMTEPFIWPEEPKDFAPWERDTYFEAKKMQEDFQESRSPDAVLKAPEKQRELLADQAKRVKEGMEPWQPTWQTLGLNFERPLLKPQSSKPSQTTS